MYRNKFVVIDLYAIWKCCNKHTQNSIALIYTILDNIKFITAPTMLSRIREIKFSELPELCSSILAEAIRNTSEYYIDLIGKVLERTEAVDNCPLQECRHRDEYVEICKYIREYLEPSSRTCIEITGLLYVKENALMYPK